MYRSNIGEKHNEKEKNWKKILSPRYYAFINRARGPYEEIFVLTFNAYGPNAVKI